MCKSRATNLALIMCSMSCATWYKGTAQLLSLTEFKIHFILAFFPLAELLLDEGGEETRMPRENP